MTSSIGGDLFDDAQQKGTAPSVGDDRGIQADVEEQKQPNVGDDSIPGQMLKIRQAIESMLEARAPVPSLKPGQVYRRICDELKGAGIHSYELPSRSTFDRFRRGFGR